MCHVRFASQMCTLMMKERFSMRLVHIQYYMSRRNATLIVYRYEPSIRQDM